MMSKKVEKALNAQINAEFWSAYLYLAMAADSQSKSLPGIANWFYVQYKEELDHGMKIFNFLVKRGVKVELMPIDKVPTKWKSVLDAFKDALKHEKEVTAMIDNLFTLAGTEKDYATQSMLQWFIDEQVEEEETPQSIIDTLIRIGDNGSALYMLDKELGARTYTPLDID
ncbi:MAG: ferritin [Bacteroidales bacterium]|jgi:ferritin|nr:ferritin [Bacteroidales bacterium]